MQAAKDLLKTIVPANIYTAAQRIAYRPRIRGRPFPFTVEPPQSGRTLHCCIAYNKYGGYCVPMSGVHRPAARRVLAGEVWEVPTIEFMSSRYTGGDIVHAGTYFGDFLPPLARFASEDARIWAFEPNPESYRCARVTVDINQLGNVHLQNAGLGERSEVLDFVTTDDGIALGGASHIARNEVGAKSAPANRTQPVQIVTVDAIVPANRPVSIVQLDVEGHEQYALTGALQTIRRSRPILILETLPDARWIEQNLAPLGYRQEAKVPDNFILTCN